MGAGRLERAVVVTLRDQLTGRSERDVTASDGSFLFRGVRSGAYEITAERDGARVASLFVSVDPGSVAFVGSLVAVETPWLTGRVADADGEGLEGVDVRFVRESALESTVVRTVATDRSGAFRLRLPPAVYRVRATAAGYEPNDREIRLGPEDRTLPDLVLSEGLRVFGDLEDCDGSEVTVDVVRAGRVDRLEGVVTTLELDPERCAFEGVVSERQRLRVVAEDSAGRRATSEPFSVLAGQESYDAGVVPWQASGPLSVRVLDGRDRRPLPGAEVRILTIDGRSYPRGEVTDTAGGVDFTDLPFGEIRLVAGRPGLADRDASIRHGDGAAEGPHTIVLDTGGTIVGRVETATGTPVPGVRLTASGLGVSANDAISDADGRFRFERVPAGRVRVTRQGEGGAIDARVISLDDGERRELRFVIGRTLDGVVRVDGRPLPFATIKVVASPEGSGKHRAAFGRTREDGTFEVPNAPSGIATAIIEVGDAMRTHPLEIPDRPDPYVEIDLGGFLLHGLLVDAATGAPIAGARLVVAAADDSQWTVVSSGAGSIGRTVSVSGGRELSQGTSRSDGSYRFEVSSDSPYTLHVDPPRPYRGRSVTVSPGVPARIPFEHGAAIQGVVATSGPATPSVVCLFASGVSRCQGISAPEFEFDDLEPGAYDIVAAGSGGRFGAIYGVTPDSEEVVRVAFRPMHEVAPIRVPNGAVLVAIRNPRGVDLMAPIRMLGEVPTIERIDDESFLVSVRVPSGRWFATLAVDGVLQDVPLVSGPIETVEAH